MIIGTAGHVDHGKSALVRALTGVDTDRLAEEKRRGVSIDLGFAYLPTPDGLTLAFIDVPGHERFVRNMLAGATGIDFALLVVAADDGLMPQTREHIAILDLLGVARGLVALTKVDLVAPGRREDVSREVLAALAPTRLAGAQIVEVSSVTGEGVPALAEKLVEAARAFGARAASGLFRLAIDRVFTLTGAGTIVTGVVLSGDVAVGDSVTIGPRGLAARVRGIHAHNRAAGRGLTGERCALNLAGDGVTKSAITRGDFALAPALHAPTQRIDAILRLLPGETRALAHWTPARLHHGAAEIAARIALIEDAPIAPGSEGRVQIVLERPTAAAAGDRYIVRDVSGGRTIGGGWFLDLRPPARRRRSPERRAQLDALAREKLAEKLAGLLACAPYFVEIGGLARDHAMAAEALGDIAQGMGARRAPAAGADYALSADVWRALNGSILRELEAFHGEAPDSPGINVENLRARIQPRLPRPVFSAVLAAFAHERLIAFDSGLVRLPGHRLDLPAKDAQLWSVIEPLLSGDERFRPPRGKEIAELLRAPEGDVRRVLKSLARQKIAFEVAPDHFFLRTTMAEMIDIAADVAATSQDGQISAAQFRDRLDNGRKVAIQILEFLDRQAVTVRRGDLRRINKQRLDLFRR